MAFGVALLSLMTTLPGVVLLPAVDRTEIVFADTSRTMVSAGDWLNPRYGDKVHAFRPIGTYWAQGAALTLADDAQARNITVYRLPGLISVVLAVFALVVLAAPVFGVVTAGLAGALFAVAPLTVLVGQLAIAEGLSLLPATVAMVALLRIYIAAPGGDTRRLAVLFWLAAGVGIAINALMVPFLVLSTVIALWIIDRNFGWLKRIHALWGIPLMLVLASPWLIVRFYQDGVPFAGMGLLEVFEALTGSQDMKLRAFPGTFLLAAVAGFLPGTAMLPPAVRRLWDDRASNAGLRFLFAWIVGYLVFNELLSSEPGTYAVQVVFPAMALAVGGLVTAHVSGSKLPRWNLIPLPPLAAALAVLLFSAVYLFTAETPSVIAITLVLLVAWLFYFSAQAGRHGHLMRWATSGITALSLFAITLLAVVLPAIHDLWPGRQLHRAIAACPDAQVSVVGFREPSASFLLGSPIGGSQVQQVAGKFGEKTPRLTIVENRFSAELDDEIKKGDFVSLPKPSACVNVYNVMRGCPLRFKVYETGAGQKCSFGPQFDCANQAAPPSFSSRDCK